MSGADSDSPNLVSSKTEIQMQWESLVEKEVDIIKADARTKGTDNVLRLWTQNRQKIQMSQQKEKKCQSDLLPIPKVAIPSDHFSGYSSSEDRRKKREFAKVYSEKDK